MKYSAINIQTVVDHQRKFRYFSILVRSSNGQALRKLSSICLFKSIPSGTHLLSDAGYKFFCYLFTPFDEPSAAASATCKRYIYLYSKTHIKVECAFDVLKNGCSAQCSRGIPSK